MEKSLMAKCRECHAEIVWIKDAAGKNIPINYEDQNDDYPPTHWVTCAKVKEPEREFGPRPGYL
jgi:hypothetical protein